MGFIQQGIEDVKHKFENIPMPDIGTASSASSGASLINGKIQGLSSLKMIKGCEILEERMGEQIITIKATFHVSNVRVKFDARYVWVCVYLLFYTIFKYYIKY